MNNRRAIGVRKRELTQLQQKAIRILIAEPGVTYQSIADRLHIDRSAVSRWAHHDELFVAELEAARTAPRESLSAEDALERLAPGEQERLTALLGQNGRARTTDRLGKLVEFLEKIESPGERRDIICELFCVLGNTMVKWRYAKSDGVGDVFRGFLEMHLELIQIADTLEYCKRVQSGNGELPHRFEVSVEEKSITDEIAMIDEIEKEYV